MHPRATARLLVHLEDCKEHLCSTCDKGGGPVSAAFKDQAESLGGGKPRRQTRTISWTPDAVHRCVQMAAQR
jgi:hypothetical protein